MTDLLHAQLPLVMSLQQSLASSSALVSCWKIITLLGNEEFFLLLLPIIYWCVSAKRGLQLGLLVIGGDALNVLVKMAFTAPRPYWFGLPFRELSADASFGLPSSHAQNSVAVWLFLAALAAPRYGRNRVFTGAIVLILLLSLSRVVLGVHFPTDILAGWLIGAAWLWFVLRTWDAAAAWFKSSNLGTRIFASLAITVGYVFAGLLLAVGRDAWALFPGVDARIVPRNVPYVTMMAAVFARAGALFGLFAGIALQLNGARWQVTGSKARKWGRFFIGLVGVLLIWKGLAAVFPKGDTSLALFFRLVRYAMLSGWVVWLAPLLFQRMGGKSVGPDDSAGPKLPGGWKKLKKGISPIAAVD